MATTIQSFYAVKRNFYVIRNGLHGNQWYCSHMTTRKSDKNTSLSSSANGLLITLSISLVKLIGVCEGLLANNFHVYNCLFDANTKRYEKHYCCHDIKIEGCLALYFCFTAILRGTHYAVTKTVGSDDYHESYL